MLSKYRFVDVSLADDVDCVDTFAFVLLSAVQPLNLERIHSLKAGFSKNRGHARAVCRRVRSRNGVLPGSPVNIRLRLLFPGREYTRRERRVLDSHNCAFALRKGQNRTMSCLRTIVPMRVGHNLMQPIDMPPS